VSRTRSRHPTCITVDVSGVADNERAASDRAQREAPGDAAVDLATNTTDHLIADMDLVPSLSAQQSDPELSDQSPQSENLW
jgi:hypothetical protein